VQGTAAAADDGWSHSSRCLSCHDGTGAQVMDMGAIGPENKPKVSGPHPVNVRYKPDRGSLFPVRQIAGQWQLIESTERKRIAAALRRSKESLDLNEASERHRDFQNRVPRRLARCDRALAGGPRARFYDETGRAAGMAGVDVDISEQKRAEAALHEQREWLRVTLTSLGDAVLTINTEKRITFVNPVAARLTGWTEEEALGRPLEEVFRIINEQTRQQAEDIVARVMREGKVVLLVNHTALVTRDGREVPIEDSAAPIRDSDSNVAGAVVVFHDVTEKRRAEEALRQSERRVRLKLESILSPVGEIRNLELGDIIDIEAVQSLMEDFYQIARIPMAIVDL
jgi:PAS domain S-box-containing protein